MVEVMLFYPRIIVFNKTLAYMPTLCKIRRYSNDLFWWTNRRILYYCTNCSLQNGEIL